jgi:uncharacterized damage-inducible protein DinB
MEGVEIKVFTPFLFLPQNHLMTTIQQLVTDLDNLHNGNCWTGYNALQILSGIDAETAKTKPYEKGNSLWQIVNHISYWRELVARRVRERKPVRAEQEGFDFPEVANEASWENTRQRFNQSYQLLRYAINNLGQEELYREMDGGQTLYYNIQGCLLHDSFHLGQVILLKRMAGITA